MTARTIPYQLRQNKAIDRYAFIELLSKINSFKDISKYKYIGFGGHSLEDFKYVHSRFGIKDMVSLEENEQAHKRQVYNRPHNCIKCRNEKSSEFINTYNRESESIFWLDYTSPSELRTQIEEFQALASKLDLYDVVKVTLNANAASYYSPRQDDKVGEIHTNRIRILTERLGDLFPSASVNEKMMTRKEFPRVISEIIRHAAAKAMESWSEAIFQPLTLFSYADGQSMLTVTGILINRSEKEIFLSKTGISDWSLSSVDWGIPKEINIPDFTVKERLFIDSMLPCSSASEIQESLEFYFGENERKSITQIDTYALFYRQSPYFSRVFI